MPWPQVCEVDISMDEMGVKGRPSLLMSSGLISSEISPGPDGQLYKPPSMLRQRNNSINSQEDEQIMVFRQSNQTGTTSSFRTPQKSSMISAQ